LRDGEMGVIWIRVYGLEHRFKLGSFEIKTFIQE